MFALPAVASAACVRTVTANFDGNCYSDILWQNTATSQVVEWFMDGSTVDNSGSPGTPGAGWSVVGVGDFNGDGMADMLWQNMYSGQLIIWYMNGATILSSASPGSAPNPSWVVQGVGDFNGDGVPDILWQNTATGDTVIWFMNSNSIASSLDLGSVPGWNVVGIGDFNGDGNADILWQNQSSGVNVIWLMSANGILSSGSPGSPGAPWAVQGIGDFNGDGYADILWQNTATGQVVVWLMQGTNILSSGSPGSPGITGAPWIVQQVGDFDGDGNSDILFYNNQTSEAIIWFMGGTSILSSASIGIPGLYWQVQTPPPYGVPAAAKQVGFTTHTFNSISTQNVPGQLYFPTKFYVPAFGTVNVNGDDSFTITNGENLPMISTTHYDKTKPNLWGGECFQQGGFFDIYAAWTPFAGSGQPSWPQMGLYDVVNVAHNSVGPWNVWGVQPITATATPSNGATSITIPAWAGSSTATLSNVQVLDSTGDFQGTFAGLYPGATVTMSGTMGGSGAISGYNDPTTYYVSAANSKAQTFTLQTMAQTPLSTTAGATVTNSNGSTSVQPLTGLTYTPGYGGTITFSDSETRLASFTAGITTVSWAQPLTGSSFTNALSVNWGANFENVPELDIVEADYPTTSELGTSFVSWYAGFTSQNKVHPLKFQQYMNVDTSQPHHYSTLWVPATATTQGYAVWYLDGVAYNTATWNLYDPGSPPAPTGMSTNQNLWTGGTAFSVVDTRCMMPFISTAQGTAAPLTVYSVSVWQATATNNVMQ